MKKKIEKFEDLIAWQKRESSRPGFMKLPIKEASPRIMVLKIR